MKADSAWISIVYDREEAFPSLSKSFSDSHQNLKKTSGPWLLIVEEILSSLNTI